MMPVVSLPVGWSALSMMFTCVLGFRDEYFGTEAMARVHMWRYIREYKEEEGKKIGLLVYN